MDELELEFQLDKQLAADSVFLGDLPLSRLLLINDKQYPWFVLVPRRENVSEIYHLSLQDREQLMVESCDLSAALADGFNAHKMNVAALGNVVKQLHLHHVVRFVGDAAWPAPVWGVHSLKPYADQEIEQIRAKIKMLLATKIAFEPVV